MTSTYAAERKYVGNIAANYVKGRADKPNWQWEQGQVEAWVRSLPKGASIVDVPFGTGRYVPFYRSMGLKVSGVDISADMIKAAEQELGSAFQGIDARVGRAEALPYEDASFDYLLSGRFIQWLPDMKTVEQALGEFSRVTRREMLLQLNIPAGQVRKKQPLGERVKKWASKPFTSLNRLWRRAIRHPSMDIKTTFHREPDVIAAAERQGWTLREIGRECPSSPGVRFYRFVKA